MFVYVQIYIHTHVYTHTHTHTCVYICVCVCVCVFLFLCVCVMQGAAHSLAHSSCPGGGCIYGDLSSVPSLPPSVPPPSLSLAIGEIWLSELQWDLLGSNWRKYRQTRQRKRTAGISFSLSFFLSLSLSLSLSPCVCVYSVVPAGPRDSHQVG
jgi:hypothetical protein